MIRIEVVGERARLYVHGNEQPTLIVNDVKSGADASGGVALWLGPGTVVHFRKLAASRDKSATRVLIHKVTFEDHGGLAKAETLVEDWTRCAEDERAVRNQKGGR